MNIQPSRLEIGILISSIVATIPVNAALYDRGNGLIYDDVLNVTWQKNANLATSETFGVAHIDTVTGSMTWNTANRWITAMNNTDYLGYNNWRLPTISPVNGATFNFSHSFNGSTDSGYNITSPNSELAFMYYVNLGNIGLYDTSGALTGCFVAPTFSCFTNTGPFDNIRTSFAFYWSGTKPDPRTEFVQGFSTSIGDSTNKSAANTFFSWVVRDGDVAVVPAPPAIILMLSGLFGLFGATIRLNRR